MECINYDRLYSLQDEVLDAVFREETEFYLTGGTCLHRFYCKRRYSDDLDLFSNSSDTFAYSARELVARLRQDGLSVLKQVDSRDFLRLQVAKEEVLLQVDLVNDRIKRFGNFSYVGSYRLDNILNILSNKITAVIGRDSPKDVFDLVSIAEHAKIKWELILAEAKEKMLFQKEELLYRLQTFPIALLKQLNVIDRQFLADFEKNLQFVVNEIDNAS